MTSAVPPVFRFAPSPNGALHLGHAYSALLNQKMARETGGTLLLRIEDIDTGRCTPELERGMIEDLQWLGMEWSGETRRQSQRFDAYTGALDRLRKMGLVYPAFMSRAEIRAAVKEKPNWPHDPDGQPHYPGSERSLNDAEREQAINEHPQHAWRLDMHAALKHLDKRLSWNESGHGPDGETGLVEASPSIWGDVTLARSDTPTSYHLSVVLDDALQSITHIVRGQDLFHATAIHRLLQELLGLSAPLYHHHELILAKDGRKLSKSSRDTSLQSLRDAGHTPDDIRRMIGL